MQTIIFYGRNGAGAKERAKELRGEKQKVMVCDVTVWEGTKDADQAEIMDCVSYFDRQRIEHVFGVGENIKEAIVDLACGEGVEFYPTNEEVIPEKKKRGRPRKNKDAA